MDFTIFVCKKRPRWTPFKNTCCMCEKPQRILTRTPKSSEKVLQKRIVSVAWSSNVRFAVLEQSGVDPEGFSGPRNSFWEALFVPGLARRQLVVRDSYSQPPPNSMTVRNQKEGIVMLLIFQRWWKSLLPRCLLI